MKRSREALEASHRPEEKERKEPRVKEVHEDGKSEEEDRSKLPQVVGDENKQAILVDPRRWARERLATHLREQGKELEQSGEHKEKEQKKPKAFDALGTVIVGSRFFGLLCLLIANGFFSVSGTLCLCMGQSIIWSEASSPGHEQVMEMEVLRLEFPKPMLLGRWPKQVT